MVERLFLQILNMSLTASIAIAVVLLARLLLRRAPKLFSWALWAAVFFRLLCPVSFASELSLLGAVNSSGIGLGRMGYITLEMAGESGAEKIWNAGSQEEMKPLGEETAKSGGEEMDVPETGRESAWRTPPLPVTVCAYVWAAGVLLLLSYNLASWIRLKRRLRFAVCEEGNVYRAENLETPFVMGIWRPRIYLPDTTKGQEKDYIVLHERIHIRRGDPLLRAAGFAALCLHWFNPLVWAAWKISGRDMEMSCDEAVIRRLGDGVKKEYSASLLNFAAGREVIGGMSLRFGEGDTGSRIRNILRYKKPAFWGAVIVAAACAVLAFSLLSNPTSEKQENESETQTEYQSYYGVLKEKSVDGAVWRLVTVPGMGEIALPEAENISPWFETEYFELENGDLLRMDFEGTEPVLVNGKGNPPVFSRNAAQIWDIARGMTLEYAGEGKYLFSFAAGLLPEEEMKEGDLLEILCQETEDKVYFPQNPSQEAEAETVAVAPILEITEDSVKIELTAEQAKKVLEKFGFGIFFSVSGRTDF